MSSTPPLPESGSSTWPPTSRADLTATIRAGMKWFPNSGQPSSATFHPKSSSVLYFLGSVGSGAGSSLWSVPLPPSGSPPPAPDAVPTLSWEAVVAPPSTSGPTKLSKEETLLRERMRASSAFGITSFSTSDSTSTLLLPAAGALYTTSIANHAPAWPQTPGPPGSSPTKPSNEGPLPLEPIPTSVTDAPRMDAKLSPDSATVAFVRAKDLWIVPLTGQGAGSELQLTRSSDLGPKFSSGVAEFAIQEEFDRYTGYWWSPNSDGLLYVIVDESPVADFSIQQAGFDGTVDTSPYPLAGAPNARSELAIVQWNNGVPTSLKLGSGGLSAVAPWAEYVARAGWLPDGSAVWAQLVNRVQQKSQLVLFPLNSFGPKAVAAPLVLVEENTNVWVNVHDVFHFWSDGSKKLIWAMETPTGFRHLHLITWNDNEVTSNIPLTSGAWQVDRAGLWVDESSSTAFFTGTKDSVLECHLYSVSFATATAKDGSVHNAVTRLTPGGFRHSGFALSKDFRRFVATGSNLDTDPVTTVYSIAPGAAGSIPLAHLANHVVKGPPPYSFDHPTLFSFENDHKETVHGAYFLPHNYKAGTKVPTLVYVYGGPHVQLVSNTRALTRSARHQLLRHLGYAVVIVDGVGSLRRGLAYEGYIREKMGQLEIAEQVAGVKHLASEVGFVDLDRVGITGWSYGGYLTFMAMAQRPDFFKMGMVGAPVSDWAGYDTAYTERYMNTPQNNAEGYKLGNVLHYVKGFPDEENRLFITHGLIDENVHFAHTSQLIQALIDEKKPYALQIYPGARHGVSKFEERVYMETNMARTLLAHL